MASDEELAAAREAARVAEAEAGQLRGEIVELKTQLARARQDQEAFQKALDAKRAVSERADRALAALRRRLR
mgnify:FL=1